MKRRTDGIGEGRGAQLAKGAILTEAQRFRVPEMLVRLAWANGDDICPATNPKTRPRKDRSAA